MGGSFKLGIEFKFGAKINIYGAFGITNSSLFQQGASNLGGVSKSIGKANSAILNGDRYFH